MDMTSLVKRAVEDATSRRYAGDEDSYLSAKVPTQMLRDLDALAHYTRVTRSQALRSVLSESLPSLINLCSVQGPNADGLTIEDCAPEYIEDIAANAQAAARLAGEKN